MTLAIFDLDQTLIPFDSDDHWGAFLVAQGLVSAAEHGDAVERFGTAYREGRLDIHEYSRFVLSPLTQHPPARLEQLRADFVRAQVVPRIASAARELVASHRAAGHTLLIITATNRFVTQPIAELFDVPHLLACEPEIVDGRYTGEIIGIPTYREGKVHALEKWLDEHGYDLAGSWFYSDSHNDLPLLERVDHPVAVDPDPILRATAKERGWRILDLHGRAEAHSQES